MSPPLLGVEEGGGHGTLLSPPASKDRATQNAMDLKERNYLGLTDCSPLEGSAESRLLGGNKSNLNLKATELRLGLPGSQSPEREQIHCLNSGKMDEKQLFPLLPSKEGICSSPHRTVFSGSKRGFSDVMEGNWMFPVAGSKTEIPPSVAPKFAAKSTVNVMIPPKVSQPATTRDVTPKEKTVVGNGVITNQTATTNKDSERKPPITKALVVGWPPIRSFRKNSLSTISKNSDEVDGKPGPGALYVKVSMDGAPYLRKVDLRNYSSYQELSSALEKMFSCFTLGQYGCHGGLERGSLSESKLKDLLHGSEYVLTYEDKDSDWMLVGDVPWEMFIDTCRKLKIMKSSDAIGLAAPRAGDKSRT